MTASRATLKDVAQRVGVAVSTVSKVVNDRPDVGPDVRRRVLQAIEDLNFRPNTIARGLRTQRSDTLAIVTDDLDGVFTSAMMRGVEEAAWSSDVGVLLCNTYGDIEREGLQLTRLLDKQVDALIFMSGNRVGPRAAPVVTVPSSIPVIYLYEYGDPTVPSVLPDDEGGARMAVEHLIARGARHVALLNGPAGWEATQDRYRGYQEALKTAGLPAAAALTIRSTSWNPDDGYECVQRLLHRGQPFDGLFCASDDLATGAVAALLDAGMAVPEQVKVVGFDDRSFAAHQRPPLSTVALPLQEMGRIAGQLALDSVNGRPPAAGIRRITCKLKIRATTQASAVDLSH